MRNKNLLLRFVVILNVVICFQKVAYADWLPNVQQVINVAIIVSDAITPLEIQASNFVAANGSNQEYTFLPADYTPNAKIISGITQASTTNGGVTTYSDAFNVVFSTSSSVPIILQGKTLVFSLMSGQGSQDASAMKWVCTGNKTDGVAQIDPTDVPLSLLGGKSDSTDKVNFLIKTPLASCQFLSS